MISRLSIYLQHQHSAPIQEVMCPSWIKAENKDVEVGLLDWCVKHLAFKETQDIKNMELILTQSFSNLN